MPALTPSVGSLIVCHSPDVCSEMWSVCLRVSTVQYSNSVPTCVCCTIAQPYTSELRRIAIPIAALLKAKYTRQIGPVHVFNI